MQSVLKSLVTWANKNRLLLFNNLINIFVLCPNSEKIYLDFFFFKSACLILTEAVVKQAEISATLEQVLKLPDENSGK